MTKQTYINIGSGIWKPLISVWKRVDGEWVKDIMPYIRVDGVWKECMPTPGIPSAEIGDDFGGGKIAYIGNEFPVMGGMIAAASDSSEGHRWGCWGTTIGGAATEIAIGKGKDATAKIVSDCSLSEFQVAAKLCDNLSINGYTDWYLPSGDELNELYENKEVIGNFFTGYEPYYWSSTETGTHSAIRQRFNNGNIVPNSTKSFGNYVRAVRGF